MLKITQFVMTSEPQYAFSAMILTENSNYVAIRRFDSKDRLIDHKIKQV